MPAIGLGFSPTNTAANLDLDVLAVNVANAQGTATVAAADALAAIAAAAAAAAAIQPAIDATVPTAGRTVSALLDYLQHNSSFNVRDYNAKGDGATDDTAAFQAAVNAAVAAGNSIVFVPRGYYKISGTITIHQGVMLVGQGSGGTTEQYGTTLIHYSNNDLLVWDGNGAANAGIGGALFNMLLIKAATYSGGTAVKLLATDDTHRPGEMLLQNVLIFGQSGAPHGLWAHGLWIDGTACVTAGSKGVRSIVLVKFRVADCTVNNQYIYVNQGVHFSGVHVQIDTGSGTGTCGMTVNADSDNVMLANCILNGNLVFSGTAVMNVVVSGRVSALDVSNPNLVGAMLIQSQSISNASLGLRIVSERADAFLATITAPIANVTGDGTIYTVVPDTEIYDNNNSFTLATGIFTCKCAGMYHFAALIEVSDLAVGHTGANLTLVHKDSGGSTVETVPMVCNPYAISTGNRASMQVTAQMQLQLGDTVRVTVQVAGGAKAVDVYGEVVNTYGRFSGQVVA